MVVEVLVGVAAEVLVCVAEEVLVGVVVEVFVCTGVNVVVLTVFTSCKARPAAITYKLQVKLSYFGFPLEVIS